MQTNLISHTPRRAAAWLAVLLGVISLGNAMAANRFNLYLKNYTAQPVTFTISPGTCYEGTPSSGDLGPVAPGDQVMMTFDYDGDVFCRLSGGEFSIKPSTKSEPQHFGSIAGHLWLRNIPNGYHGALSAKSPVDESYTWTMQEVEARLSGPVDERLTRPRNYIAADSGQWGLVTAANATSKVETLQFSSNGFLGSFYFSCSEFETFHAQHVKRLPNKNGRAYFMVSQSRAHNGYLYLVETYPGVLDPVTDRIPNGFEVGKIIWQDVYTGSFNGTINPIGNWNHPGKMSLQGGVLVVAAQNWSEEKPIDGCTHSTSNPY